MDYMDFKETVRKRRKRKGFTQVQLADKSGLSENTIRSIENVKQHPQFKIVLHLRKHLESQQRECLKKLK